MTNIVSTTGHGSQFPLMLFGIDCISKHSNNIVDKVLIWNFDLNSKERNTIKKLQKNNDFYRDKVDIVRFPKECYFHYPSFFIPTQFAWLPALFWFSRDFGDNIMWMGGSKPPITSLDKVFNVIERDGILFGSLSSGKVKLGDKMTNVSKKLLNTSKEDLVNPIVSTVTGVGYNKHSEYNNLVFKNAYESSKIKDIIQGPKAIHGRDQVVFSYWIGKTNYKIKNMLTNEPVDLNHDEIPVRTILDDDGKPIIKMLRFDRNKKNQLDIVKKYGIDKYRRF